MPEFYFSIEPLCMYAFIGRLLCAKYETPNSRLEKGETSNESSSAPFICSGPRAAVRLIDSAKETQIIVKRKLAGFDPSYLKTGFTVT